MIVYVVVSIGDTSIDPAGPTAPMPGSIVHEFAFADVQVSKLVWPGLINAGSAAISTTGGGSTTVMVIESAAGPPEPVAVMV